MLVQYILVLLLILLKYQSRDLGPNIVILTPSSSRYVKVARLDNLPNLCG
jgi:hypothetical protein